MMKTQLQLSRSVACMLLVGSLFFSCKKKTEDPQPEEEKKVVAPPVPIPVFKGSIANMVNDTVRIGMFKNLMEYAYSANFKGVFIDSINLKNQYIHNGNPFYNQNLNNRDDISIKQALNPAKEGQLLAYFKRISEASKSKVDGSVGNAGVILYAGNTKNGKLLDQNGMAIDELIEKHVMGAFQTYQLCSVLLVEAKVASSDSVSNLKNWDMAFAQLGIPLDYGNKDYYFSIPLWGKYLKINDGKLGGNISKILNAFVAGRQAVIEKNKTATMAHAQIIKDEIERAAAGMVITGLNAGVYYNQLGYSAEKNSALSSGLGFLYLLQNIPTKKISDAKLNEFIGKLEGNNWTLDMNVVKSIIAEFSSIYGLNSSVFNSI